MIAAPISEQAVLSAFLLEPKTHWMIGRLTEEHFTCGPYRAIFAAIQRLNIEHKPVDVPIVGQATGLMSDCIELATAYVSSANVESYVESVIDNYQRRQIRAVCQEVGSDADGEKADTLIDRLVSRVSEITMGRGGQAHSFADALASAEVEVQEAENARKRGVVAGIPAGLPMLDKRMGGYHRKRLGIFAGRPGWGKTALMLTGALEGAMRGHPGAIASLEMPKEDLGKRAICSLAGISYGGLLNGYGTQEFRSACAKYRGIPLKIDDVNNNIGAIISRAHELKHTHNIEHFWIDYIGLIQGSSSRERRDRLAEYSVRLKGLAKELDIFVGLLVQLSRQCEIEKRRPNMSDIADCGDIEKDADFILALNPRSAYMNGRREMELGFLKSRLCAPGWSQATFDFNGDFQQYRERAVPAYGMDAA